jgi:endoglucanase
MPVSPWNLNTYECYEAPAVVALFYHNVYEEGKQGGFELLQQGRRIAGNGNLRLDHAPDQWAGLPTHNKRQVLPSGGGLQVTCDYSQAGIRYTVRLKPEGDALRLSVDLAQPLPLELVGKVGFNLELVPDVLMGKTFSIDSQFGIFPRQFDSPLQPAVGGGLAPVPLATGEKLAVTPEDARTHLDIEAIRGELLLLDGRAEAENGWFVVRSLVPAGATVGAVEWLVRPYLIPGWLRTPVIAHSQVGYHPNQKKCAAIELDQHIIEPGEARLVRLLPDGSTRLVRSAWLTLWGAYLCYHYAIFDFSEVTEPGIYRLEYEDQVTAPFPISPLVYRSQAWQPTLEVYFPVQMCHVAVRDGYRVWHGACHLDDALQAPLNHSHFDSYVQSAVTESPYVPMQHIPHLDVGGWHDAGDYDLAAGSQAHTTLALVYARELFGVDIDQMAVQKDRRLVLMHTPDGVPDIVQQVAHGVENLLSGYRAVGHSFIGIIESNLQQYVHLGDPAVMTDNQISEGLPPFQADDRWAFTNRNSALEYLVMAALAASSRVLAGFEDALAGEALRTAEQVWDFEQSHPPQESPNCYAPRNAAVQSLLAAAELFKTTGKLVYRTYLLDRQTLILDHLSQVGGAVAGILGKLDDIVFIAAFHQAVAAYSAGLSEKASQNPFGVAYTADEWRTHAPVWGVAWPILSRASNLYLLHRACPGAVDRDLVVAALGYTLGCHPVSDVSLVSGVGARSLTSAYGNNRADWTYIPGGVVSGPALLLPNYSELLDPFPFLWMQKEYVMSGAANYILMVLAVDDLLK